MSVSTARAETRPARWEPTLIDLTRPIVEATGYAMWGDMLDDYPHLKEIRIDYIAEFPKDQGTVCRFEICDHTGTHVDAPIHMLEGTGDMASVDLSRFSGEAVV